MSRVFDFFNANPYLHALVLLVASVLAALLVDIITKQVMMRLARKTETVLDDEIISALRKPLFLSVVMIGAEVAITPLEPTEPVQNYTRVGLVTLAILIWTLAGMRISKSVLQAMSNRIGEHKFVHPRTVPLFDIALKTLIFGGAAYGLLLTWNVDISAWLASAGILGIAIGFAAKDTLSNLFSGIFILADAPYKLGDFVVLDSGERGQVTDIGMRSTRILTRDDIQIIIPNAAIANAKIVNESGGPHVKERVRINVGVSYDSDIDLVRQVLLDIAKNSSYLVQDPEPRVRFREFADSSLNFQLLGWIEEPIERGKAIDELNTAIFKRFNQEGIRIPFPQRDVHIEKKPEVE